MTTEIKPLHEEAVEAVHDFCMAVFLDGECYAFAIAMHRNTNWTLMGLIAHDQIKHAIVQDENGIFYDARGPVSEQELGKPFHIPPPYELKTITEDDLRRIRPVQELSIKRAQSTAEILWPNFPFKKSIQAKITAFADDLEKISREHGLWIRSPFPASLPLLAETTGDEQGYTLEPTHDGLTFTIDRRL